MKPFYIVTFIFLMAGIGSVAAQDIIILKDGNMIEAKVTEISRTEIRYKRFNHLDGPTIVIPAADVLSVKYANGEYEVINAAPNTAARPAPPAAARPVTEPPAATPREAAPPAEEPPAVTPPEAAPPAAELPAAAPPADSDYMDFTAGQRWGTFLFNVIPGIGSFAIMQDKVGGFIHMTVGGVGLVLFLVGLDVLNKAWYSYTDSMGHSYEKINDTEFEKGAPLYVIGLGLLGIDLIFNIVRSVRYHKPRPETASLIDPAAWNIAVLPGKDGIEQVSLSYTLRF